MWRTRGTAVAPNHNAPPHQRVERRRGGGTATRHAGAPSPSAAPSSSPRRARRRAHAVGGLSSGAASTTRQAGREGRHGSRAARRWLPSQRDGIAGGVGLRLGETAPSGGTTDHGWLVDPVAGKSTRYGWVGAWPWRVDAARACIYSVIHRLPKTGSGGSGASLRSARTRVQATPLASVSGVAPVESLATEQPPTAQNGTNPAVCEEWDTSSRPVD